MHRRREFNAQLASRNGVLTVDKSARALIPNTLSKFSSEHLASVRRYESNDNEADGQVPFSGEEANDGSVPSNTRQLPTPRCRHWSPVRVLHCAASECAALASAPLPICHIRDTVASVQDGNRAQREHIITLQSGLVCHYWAIDLPLPAAVMRDALIDIFGMPRRSEDSETVYFHVFVVRAA